MALGNFLKFLAVAHLYPLPPAHSYPHSYEFLHNTLLEFIAKGRNKGLGDGHSGCCLLPGLVENVESVLSTDKLIITDSQKSHIEAQARKSGVTKGPLR